WWLSPPCQPYCLRGNRLDLDDPRGASLKRLMGALAEMRDGDLPTRIALENVEGFGDSAARELVLQVLRSRGYHLAELLLCPTSLGVPSRRPRYYLAASRVAAPLQDPPPAREVRPLAAYLDEPDDHQLPPLLLPPEVLESYGSGLRIVDPSAPAAYTTCFTSGYGKSVMHAGSYIRCRQGIRRFSPGELARLLHLPEGFRFPAGMSLRRKWHFLGNSLSVVAVREVLRRLGLQVEP
ncbi:MAG TPA: DNA cytosine methyltransferase, partial [Verrucomicrobiae bacterium]|nr:DNA cytosine methyltransferase [Verrucomicrobiae bacterium]